MEDKRFSSITQDPKFRRIPKTQKKVKIDRRFQSMFTDKNFQLRYSVDKRGRPVKHQSKEDLKRYYEVSSDEATESSDDESDLDESNVGRYVRVLRTSEENGQDNEETENNSQLETKHKTDKNLSDTVKGKLQDLEVDYARGERALFTDSSSDDEESDDELSESETIDHKWGELDIDAERTEVATYRLAVCNLDWDRIRAVDLMVLFNSFLPPGGVIESVAIYPSEFGKERLIEEEIKGPIELVEVKKDLSDNETEEGSKYHMEKLRQYQLNRLKYYYSVITFDNASSASKIYTECDGMEYESSATKIDLRFIPDEMTFEDDPKEICNKLPSKYQPRFFTTTALQQAKVNLTWDETNPDRLELTNKLNSGKIDDISEQDLQNYLAGSSSEEELLENENTNGNDSDDSQPSNLIDKYKTLLQNIEEEEEKKKNNKFEMEISWDIDAVQKTDKLIKERQEQKQEKTPFEKYLDKRKAKRKEKKESKKNHHSSEDSDVPSDIDMSDPYFAEEFNKPEFKSKSNKKKEKYDANETVENKQKEAELDLLLMNDGENEKKHFNLKEIQDEQESKSKKKRKYKKPEEKKDTDDFEVDVEDERFSALFSSHLYNIDPTDPHYKKTKGMEKFAQEKLKRRNDEVLESGGDVLKAKKKTTDLNLLVKSVKRKAKAFRK